MANHRLYPFRGHLTEALRTGLPQNEFQSGGPGLFETLYADPVRLKDYQTFVDVGTAQGDLAAQVALANPPLRGEGLDPLRPRQVHT